MKYHEDKQMNSDIAGVDALFNKDNKEKSENAKGHTRIKQSKSVSRPKRHSKRANRIHRPTKHKSEKKAPKDDKKDYPWTSLLGVREVAKLDAIKQLTGCKSRTEALDKVLSHCHGLIKPKDRVKYTVLSQVFIDKDMPKAKARYHKYFNKNK